MPSSSSPVADPGTQEILQVNFSLDGKTWTKLGNIDASNWQNVSFDLPISSWQDLQNLQISVLGFSQGGNLVQNIYLDGMDVSVQYGDQGPDPSSLILPITPAPQPSAAAQPAPAAISAPVTFSPGAKQTCSIEPYSEILGIGKSTKFGLSLHPSATSTPPSSIEMGELPAGITGAIVPNAGNPLHPNISLAAAPDAAGGSFNIIVIYTEKNVSGTALSNYCQFNLSVQ